MFFLFNLTLFFNFTILYCFCHISTCIHHRYTTPKNWSGRNTSKLILCGHNHPDILVETDRHNTKKRITGQSHWWTEMQKFSTKYMQTNSSDTLKRSYTGIKWSHHRDAQLFHICKLASVICHIIKLKNKNYMMTSVDA